MNGDDRYEKQIYARNFGGHRQASLAVQPQSRNSQAMKTGGQATPLAAPIDPACLFTCQTIWRGKQLLIWCVRLLER